MKLILYACLCYVDTLWRIKTLCFFFNICNNQMLVGSLLVASKRKLMRCDISLQLLRGLCTIDTQPFGMCVRARLCMGAYVYLSGRCISTDSCGLPSTIDVARLYVLPFHNPQECICVCCVSRIFFFLISENMKIYLNKSKTIKDKANAMNKTLEKSSL